MKKLIIKSMSLLLFILVSMLYSQDDHLFEPLNFQSAVENNTRSTTGKPGKEYWQNHADYKIDVNVYPGRRLLVGSEQITYYNNSLDTLGEIVIRLYPDLYKKGNVRDMIIDPEVLHDGVFIKEVKINNQIYDLNTKDAQNWRSGTNLIIPLKEALAPEQKINLFLSWQYIIPNKSQIRTGAYDENTFFLAYWYPQISVYDDISGWDKSDYTGNQEFYNDFKNFEVRITLPAGFTVWATGLLKNPNDVLPEQQRLLLEKAKSSNEVINIISPLNYKEADFLINPTTNAWQFTAELVSDFAFGFSNYFLWDATSIKVSNQDKPVLINAAFRPEAEQLYQVCDIARKTVDYFSNVFPAIPYPFPVLTVFNGRGGMEFPMIINDGITTTLSSTIGLTAHETMHSYFPFFMGTNEKKYAWMDEGLTVMLAFDFQQSMDPETDRIAARVKNYKRIIGTDLEVPTITSSLHLTGTPYRNAAYDKPAMAYYFLRGLLGDELFIKALHTYVERWNGKHPTPHDFFYTFNEISGENLNWFWNPWFFEFGYPDLAIQNVELTNELLIIVSKVGNIPIPIEVTVFFADGSQKVINKSTRVWKDKETANLNLNFESKPVKIVLGSEHIPDANLKNNQWLID